MSRKRRAAAARAPRGAFPALDRRALAVALGLAALTALAYGPVTDAGYIWDDDRYVTDNPVLSAPGGLAAIWFDLGATVQYYPMVFSTFWVEHRLWGLHPLGYHLVNVLLHALSAVLLWRVLRRLGVPGALLAAAIFAVHPVHVESVAWVTERKNVLSGVFYLGAALAWLRIPGLLRPGSGPAPPWRAYVPATLLFTGALLAKTVTCSLPAALLLVLAWKRGRLDRRRVAALLPMFAIGIALAMVTVWMEKNTVRAEGVDWALTFVERLLIASRAPWFYLDSLVRPVGLTFIYPRWSPDPSSLAWWAFPAAGAALLAGLWAGRRRFGAGPLVAALFFVGTLFPALGFVDTYPMRYSFVADHFQYLASLGPIALLAAILATLARRLRPPAVPLALGALLVVSLAGLTWRQCGIYRDRETLWTANLAVNPASFIAHNNLGVVKAERGDETAAEAHYRAAIDLKPDFHEAHNNLGRLLVARGVEEEGTRHLRRALEIKPDAAAIVGNLAKAAAARGDWEEAIARSREAVARAPGSAPLRRELATVLAEAGRADEARLEFDRAISLDPSDAVARSNRAALMLERGDVAAAERDWREALALDPDLVDARLGLGRLLVGTGRPADALPHLERASALRPDSAPAQDGLGQALTRLGRFEEARAAFRRVAGLDPANANAHCNVGLLEIRLGRPAEAEAAFRAALAADPGHPRAREELARLGG